MAKYKKSTDYKKRKHRSKPKPFNQQLLNQAKEPQTILEHAALQSFNNYMENPVKPIKKKKLVDIAGVEVVVDSE